MKGRGIEQRRGPALTGLDAAPSPSHSGCSNSQCRLTDITSFRADITCCHNLENFECVASLRRGDEPTRANRKERAPSLISHDVGLGSLRSVNTRRSFHGRQFNDGHVQDPTGSFVRSEAQQAEERSIACRRLAQFLVVASGGKASRTWLEGRVGRTYHEGRRRLKVIA